MASIREGWLWAGDSFPAKPSAPGLQVRGTEQFTGSLLTSSAAGAFLQAQLGGLSHNLVCGYVTTSRPYTQRILNAYKGLAQVLKGKETNKKNPNEFFWAAP